MYDQSSIELLEATHDFPGPYMFKMVGRVDNGFVARVVAAVREELHAGNDPPYHSRHTASGSHVSVTVEPKVETADQVLSIYRRVREINGLIMLW
jgi:putative lipoic acid-binding regulatory protein